MRPFDELATGSLVRSPDGHLYEIIGFIDQPAALLHRVSDGAEKVIIPSSPNAKEWEHVAMHDGQSELLSIIREMRR